MQSSISLRGLGVMVTRPGTQGEELCAFLESKGASPIYFPTLQIDPPDDIPSLEKNLLDLNLFDWAIFISPQAVKRALPYMKVLPQAIAAMGKGTAAELRKHNIAVHIYPEKEWSSEGLLKLPEFSTLANKKIAIIKGQGGREILANELEARGAKITEINAYKRSLPQIHLNPYLDRLRQEGIDVIICTSNEGMVNLKTLLSNEWHLVKKIPILVISNRMKMKAEELGFEKIILADQASHEAIVDALTLMRKNLMKNHVTATPAEQKSHSFNWRWIGILFSSIGLLLLLLLISFYVSNIYYSKLFAKQADEKVQFNQLQQQIGSLTTQSDQLMDKINTQQQALTTLQQTQTGFNRNEWLILEAEFLVKLANDKLQFENNITQAIQLLQAADKEINNLNDANLLPVRKAIADDIVNLQITPKIDIQGLYLQLAALSDQLTKLPLINKSQQNNSLTMAAQNLPWWKKGLLETWQGLKQIVVVRYYTGGKPPLILPEAQSYLFMNLHSELEKTMWALLHQQPDIYKLSLGKVIKWINEYFVVNTPMTQTVLHNLEQLRTVDVKPSIPSVSASLQAFQEYFATHKS